RDPFPGRARASGGRRRVRGGVPRTKRDRLGWKWSTRVRTSIGVRGGQLATRGRGARSIRLVEAQDVPLSVDESRAPGAPGPRYDSGRVDSIAEGRRDPTTLPFPFRLRSTCGDGGHVHPDRNPPAIRPARIHGLRPPKFHESRPIRDVVVHLLCGTGRISPRPWLGRAHELESFHRGPGAPAFRSSNEEAAEKTAAGVKGRLGRDHWSIGRARSRGSALHGRVGHPRRRARLHSTERREDLERSGWRRHDHGMDRESPSRRSAVLVAPGSAGQFLPEYATVHLVFPMNPVRQSWLYAVAVCNLTS